MIKLALHTQDTVSVLRNDELIGQVSNVYGSWIAYPHGEYTDPEAPAFRDRQSAIDNLARIA